MHSNNLYAWRLFGFILVLRNRSAANPGTIEMFHPKCKKLPRQGRHHLKLTLCCQIRAAAAAAREQTAREMAFVMMWVARMKRSCVAPRQAILASISRFVCRSKRDGLQRGGHRHFGMGQNFTPVLLASFPARWANVSCPYLRIPIAASLT